MVYFFPLFSAPLTPLARLLRDPILAERRARWGRRGASSSPTPPPLPGARPGAHPRRCGGISAGAPGPSSAPRPPGWSFIRLCLSPPLPPSTRVSPRARRPLPCPVLPPPVTFGSWALSPPTSIVAPRPGAPTFLFYQRPPSLPPLPVLVPGSTPPSLGLHHASPGHAALLVTCLEVGAPIP